MVGVVNLGGPQNAVDGIQEMHGAGVGEAFLELNDFLPNLNDGLIPDPAQHEEPLQEDEDLNILLHDLDEVVQSSNSFGPFLPEEIQNLSKSLVNQEPMGVNKMQEVPRAVSPMPNLNLHIGWMEF